VRVPPREAAAEGDATLPEGSEQLDTPSEV
jgi:hypothetical protein